MTTPDDERYPIGQFNWHAPASATSRRAALDVLWTLPAAVHREADGATEAQLDTPYRPGGWSVRQVLHHLADSHLHGYVRHKTALVEDNPLVRPYDEEAWARLPDAHLPASAAVALLEAITMRWSALCDRQAGSDLERRYTHAVHGPVTIDTHLHFFAWHARHHLAQIARLRDRERR
jgi:hypothetical protein